MIMARSPLRISLGGGGTDLPSYYQHHGGSLIAASINKYVYVSVMTPFMKGIFLKYSQQETVRSVPEIQHDIIRETLSDFAPNTDQIEITTLADIPTGTGLGSSGSFTTGLIQALHAHNNRFIAPNELAELACKIEIDVLQQPIGKQDQYIAAFGGLSHFEFLADGSVQHSRLDVSADTLNDLDDNLLLFFTGFSRSASEILEDQNSKSIQNNQSMIENLHYTKRLGALSKESLIKGDLREFGQIMNEHWQYKMARSQGMTRPQINDWYDLAMKSGAVGGKLVGAGGGGFLMFYAEDKKTLRKALSENGLREVRFSIDHQGTRLL